MKKLIQVLLLPLFLSSGLQAQDAELEKRIEKQVQKVITYPNNQKHLDNLNYFYSEANRMDNDRISELKASGGPDIWYEIYLRLNRLDERQKMVMSVPLTSLEKIGFRKVDYSVELEQAKRKSAAFFYAHASALLDSGGKSNAQLAYDELFLLARMYTSYRDLDKMIRRAVPEAAENLRFEIHNKTGGELNSSIVKGISQSFGVLTDKKATYEGKGEALYDFIIQINIEEVDVTPEQVKIKKYREERDIYGEGDEVIDTISCDVTEHFQRKSSTIKGTVSYIDNRTNTIINSVPVMVESVFVHRYASVQGNPDAMGGESRSLVERREAEYPPDEELISDAVEKFRQKTELIFRPFGK